MILGDNFFYGQSLSKMLNNCVKIKNGAKVVLHRVINPENFGVAVVKRKKIISKQKYITFQAIRLDILLFIFLKKKKFLLVILYFL